MMHVSKVDSTPINKRLVQSMEKEKDTLNCCMRPLRHYHKNNSRFEVKSDVK